MRPGQAKHQAAPAPRFQFDNTAPAGLIRLSTQKLADQKDIRPGDRTVINLARVVEFRDHFYGKVKLTAKLFQQMIANFEANTYGQDIFIDVSHDPGQGAAATIKKLFLDGTKFRAEVEWNEYGIDAVKKRGFRYLSIDFATEYVNPEDKDETPMGAVLFGAALTTRPRVKNLEPVQLSFDQVDDPDAIPCGFAPLIQNQLLSETNTMNKYLKLLTTALAAMKLSDGVQKQLVDSFKLSADGIENEDTLKALAAQFEAAGKQLAEQIGDADRTIQLNLQSPQGQTLSEADVRRMMDEARQAERDAVAAEQATLGERQQQFDNLMDAAFDAEKGSLRCLSEADQKAVRGARDLITAQMSEDQVKTLADNQITIGGQLVVAAQLAERGYQAAGNGNVRIDVNESNTIQRYQEEIRNNLRNTMSHASGALQLSENAGVFVRQVLDVFDAQHARELINEGNVMLASGGTTTIGDSSLPVGVQRTVIMEALSDLRVLELVQTLTDAGATATTQIPYETRDASAIMNGGIVYEGQEIHRAGVVQAMDTAYITPMKLAMIVSNEVAHFSRASQINWDAWGRNVASNARIMRELIAARICNELQRAADSYAATDVSAESVTPDGTTRIFKTANFPVIRPHQVKDLQGTNVGSAQSPITVTDDGSPIDEYDGSGTQSAGNYYQVLNYNLGYIKIVDESGAASAPAGAVTCTYSYSSNVVKVDTDLGSDTVGVRWNDVLRAFGARKAILNQERYVTPNYALMSATLNDSITNADSFVASLKRNGTATDGMGDLETIKNVPGYGTNAPNIDLGEERILIGQRGTLSYTISKAFSTGAPFEAVGTNGKPTGQKQAYGEEYSAIHVPTPLRGYMTSVIAYSVTGRAAV